MPRDLHTPLPQPVFDEPTFNEGTPSPDPTGFQTTHPSDTDQYKAIEALLTKDVVSFPPSRLSGDAMYSLADAYGPHGPDVVKSIQANGQIVFHAGGDSGASNPRKYSSEIRVSDQVTAECQSAATADRPSFFFHLGDVVYDFGESKYYYDQFYEPFRNYPAPIFAIPGNHDSFVIPGTAAGQTPLDIFMRNFCAAQPGITQEAGSLHRTAMTEPGVYFTLDAPYVRIIGLFSNALEDPGVISSQGGKWNAVPDVQLAYLSAQLKRIKTEAYGGAVLLAVHHPPFTYGPPPASGGKGGNHGSSTLMLHEIDTVCKAEGVYPHAFLSGHAHNYQRYTRTVKGFGAEDYDVPFLVSGSSGHDVNPLVQASKGKTAQEPTNGADVSYLDVNPAVSVGGLLLERHDDKNYGYLRITVNTQQVSIGFHEVASGSIPQSRIDMVTVDLQTHQMIAN